jgi:predicted nucleic acid-binding Zn ribbon protein
MNVKKCVVCESPLSGQKQKYCSNKCKQKHHYHRVKQQTNTYHSQTMRALTRKLELVEMMGGCCSKCGYNENVSALHFHHKDSSQKQFKLGMRILSNRKMEAIKKEAEKCELLCANCHAERHNPELSMKNVRRITHGAPGRKLSGEKGVNSGKP